MYRSVLGQRFEMNYVPDIISGPDIEIILLSGILADTGFDL